MTAPNLPVKAVKSPSFWRWATGWMAGEKRYSVETVTSSDKFSAWKQLLVSWGVNDDLILDEKTAQSIPAFNRAIEIIATQIASLPISIYRSEDNGNRQEAKDHPLYQLLKFRPHPLYNSGDFRAAIIRILILRGNCFVRVVGSRGGIKMLEIIDERTADIVKVGTNYFYKFSDINETLSADEVLHFKINSMDGISGQSTLDLFKDCLERAQAEIRLGKMYYTKGGQVGGVLAPDQPMDVKQFEQARAAWNRTNIGMDKMGQVGMLPIGVKYVKLGDSLNENQLNESRARTTEDISNMTGVHPILLGAMDSATFSNVEELNRVFVQFTLRSFIKIIEDEFNTKAISKSERDTVRVRFNTAGLLRGDTSARADYYMKMRITHAMSPNEIRALENMNSYEGGDRYDLPLASNIKPQEPQSDQNSNEDEQG
jgi:HK97 family phage portal protein